MCVNQKCLSIADLQARIGTCPNGCNDNGVCNSLGHCHCNRGYRSPDCLEPGFGGSVDSGPAQDPNGIETKPYAQLKSYKIKLYITKKQY